MMLDRWPYIVNLLMLLPAAGAMWLAADGGLKGVFEGKVADAPAFRIMILGFWTAVAVGSVLGLLQPARWAPLLIVQVIYKSVWLLAFAWPAFRAGGIAAVPSGVAVCFLFIVCSYPFAIVRLMRTLWS